MTPPLLPFVRTFRRRLVVAGDPVSVFRHLTDDGQRPGAALLQAPGHRRVLLGLVPALSLRAEGGHVGVRAHTRDATALLDILAAAHPSPERRSDGCLELAYSLAETRGGPDDEDRTRLTRPGALDMVRALLRAVALPYDPPPLFGAFGFDLLEHFEGLPAPQRDERAAPDFLVTLPALTLEIDPTTGVGTARAFAFGARPKASKTSGPDADADAKGRLGTLVRALEHLSDEKPALLPPAPIQAAPQLDLDDEHYSAIVERCQEHIRAGDVFQIVPSRAFELPCPRPAAAFAELAGREPDAHRFYFVDDDGAVLFGASPECAVRVDRAPEAGPDALALTLTPIAGTRPRGRGPDGVLDLDEDDRRHADLLADPKERAEHMMLVDLARNDVARVSRPRSRRVTRLCEVEKHHRVMHLVSEVRGILDDGLDALHAVRAALHAGTLIGAPKVRAAELLRELEPGRRGFYGGAVGQLSPDGTLDLAIVIRSARVTGGRALVRAGAGVVRDSVPALEAAETRAKASSVLSAIQAAGGAA